MAAVMVGAFAWQGWVFLGSMILLPIVLAAFLARGK